MKSSKAESAEKIHRLEDYIISISWGDLPSAQEIHAQVGRILGLWK